MQFYNVELKGTFLLEKRISSPAYQSADEGRLFYYTDDVYLADSTSQVKIWSERNVSELRTALGTDGVWTIAQGGTNADNTADARTNLGVGGLTTDNAWTGKQCISASCSAAGHYGMRITSTNDTAGMWVCSECSPGIEVYMGANSGTGLVVCQTTGANGNAAISALSDGGVGVSARSTNNHGVDVNSANCYGIYACSCGSGIDTIYATHFHPTSTTAAAIYGHSAYCNMGVCGESCYGVGVCGHSRSCYGVQGYSQFDPAIYGCSLGQYGVFGCSVSGGTYAAVFGRADGVGVGGYSECCYGMRSCSIGPAGVAFGLYARAPYGTGVAGVSSSGVGICGSTNGAFPGVCGFSGSTNGVSSNNGYTTTSSKYLKYLDSVCLSNCLKERPLTVYKYYWEDSNSHGFSEAIGPTSEDFNKTFNIDHLYYGDDYLPLVNVDGAALGLGIENLTEIEKLKEIVTQLYGCIQKLEEKE